MQEDERWMAEAVSLAKTAAEQGEVPVGAVVVKDGRLIGSAYNLRQTRQSATAHAEVLAIEEACRTLGNWHLTGCTLYVTMEPCPMCAGAVINARLARVVYGVKDPAAGCCGSLLNLNAYPFFHAFRIEGGVREEESRELLQTFFRQQRKSKKDVF